MTKIVPGDHISPTHEDLILFAVGKTITRARWCQGDVGLVIAVLHTQLLGHRMLVLLGDCRVYELGSHADVCIRASMTISLMRGTP